jgi:hypothetical protein
MVSTGISLEVARSRVGVFDDAGDGVPHQGQFA